VVSIRPSSSEERRAQTHRDSLDEFAIVSCALCYTKIVPSRGRHAPLYYARMIICAGMSRPQAAEIDRLCGVHYVSHDASNSSMLSRNSGNTATQDADPSAFESMRQPIKHRAMSSRAALTLRGISTPLRFSDGGYRRPLTGAEKEVARMYRKLREQRSA